ncbi:MAG: DUF255 domain-containing protein [Pseudarcicella sp.]|nr:DUF255 domain-containing protein [Pseudarcicella sp.]MBP6409925.1 DUF255 domain-containing protein [Pseudarcicella sp.]
MKQSILIWLLWCALINTNLTFGQKKVAASKPKTTSLATTPKETKPEVKVVTEEKKEIKWMSLEQAFSAIQKEPKKIIIDIYTSWCGWCKVMDKNTFSDPKIIAYVNENYYAVKLDAEQKEDINLGPQKYTWVKQGNSGYNQAAVALLNGKMSFPTMVYLDEKFNMIQPVPGYQDANQLHKVISFFGGNHNKTMDWAKFESEVYPKLTLKN